MLEIKPDLENGRRLEVDARRKCVREVVDDVRSVTKMCSKRQFEVIAQTVVTMYPNTVEDRVGDIKIGTGYDSLMKQLKARNNFNRIPVMKYGCEKEPVVTPEAGSKRKSVETDSYGYIN